MNNNDVEPEDDHNGMLDIQYLDNQHSIDNEFSNSFRELWKTPICIAISNSNYDALDSLLKNGEDPYIEDGFGITPLSLAISNSNYEAIAILLQNGVDPNYLNSKSIAPLSYAIVKRDLTAIKLLLDNGALLTKDDGYGSSPMKYCLFIGAKDVIEFLVQYTNKNNIIADVQNPNTVLATHETFCSRIFKTIKDVLELVR